MFSNIKIRFIEQEDRNRYKLFINHSDKVVFSKFFTNFVVPIWNHLPDSCFNVDSILY